ncbi:PAS domain S-box protein [Methylopila sp. Yamaguchi]|uniref:PAS domain S-box protein n=1 Tax=Methylopila sp. Yamaguchi TaxID=1437817 RepID=UPI000CBF5DE3|nr:PAS domain S-box protein [Methylopila sp. Yamaguchi]GBD47862.1 signal transduction histidine kinase [Methylopila sp. Yamaguchi]
MTENATLDAIAADPRLASLDGVPGPVMALRADGTLVWANMAARTLQPAARFEPSAMRAAAAAARGGLVRLRVGAAGAFAPQLFKAQSVVVAGEPLVVLASPEVALAALEGPAAPAAAIPLETAAAPTLTDDAGATPDALRAVEEADAPAAELAADAAKDERASASEPTPPTPLADPAALRFVFEIDADGRIAFVSPDLADVVGASGRGLVGQSWAETSERLGLDPDGQVTQALSQRSGWNGARVSWPIEGGGRLPVTLSALPMFDRGRTFIGFRGLGLAVAPALEAPAEEIVASEPEAEVAEAPAAATADAAPEAEAEVSFAQPGPALEPEPEPEAKPEPPEAEARLEPPAIFAAPPPPPFPANVVHLRETAAARVALTPVEENAFDEIARRLRGLGGADGPAAARAVWEDIAADAEMSLGSDTPSLPTAPAISPSADDFVRMLDRLPLGALVLSGGRVAYANKAALDLTGHGDLASLAARPPERLFAEPAEPSENAPATLKLLTADGSVVEVEATLAAIAWNETPSTLVALRRPSLGVEAARRREQELAAILDTATDGVLTLDSAGRILSMNRSAEALLGYESREIVGSLFSLALAPESRRTAFEYLDSLRDSAVASLLNDGREVLGLVRQGGAVPLYLTLGRIGQDEDARFCAVLRDVTHWKRAEEELIAAKRQAERANAQKSDFLAKVSHEIRTPLNAIVGFAEVMMEERFGAIGNDRYKDYLKDIHLSGRHLVSLVNDLLDLAKIEAGKLELEFREVDLNEIAAEAVAQLQPEANRGRIIIRTSLARSLPPVRADLRSARQIVLNLAMNAVKLTPGGGQVIVATAINDLGEPVVRVRDAGAGMSKKELALALEPFRPLTTTGPDGAGVGLPLTKALVEANNAKFAIQSTVGAGTLIEVTFQAFAKARR